MKKEIYKLLITSKDYNTLRKDLRTLFLIEDIKAFSKSENKIKDNEVHWFKDEAK